MAWQDYWQTQIDGIEEADAESQKTWLEALALLLLLESRLRRKLARRVVALPVNEAQFIDHLARDAVLRFRIGVRQDVSRWIQEASLAITGRATLGDTPTTASQVPSALAPDAVRKAMATFQDTWDRGRKVAAKDKAKAAAKSEPPGEPPPGAAGATGGGSGSKAPTGAAAAGGGGSGTPGDITETDQPPEARREAIDLIEVTEDQLLNILRNVGFEGRRVEETLIRTTGRFNTVDDALDFLLGQGDRRRTRAPTDATDEGWRMNRNNLRLSIVSHVRGAYRRRTVSEATAAGDTAFRLDVPGRYLGKVEPNGVLGPELWRVRERNDWLEIQSTVNAGRVSSSAWDTLGLGFGDVSYLVAVPLIYRAAAEAQGEKLRQRWLDGEGK